MILQRVYSCLAATRYAKHLFMFTKVYICSGMAYGTSSMGSWDLVCRMGCAEYTYLYSDNIYSCYSFIGLYAKDYIFTYAYSVNL